MPDNFKEGIRRYNFQDGLGLLLEWKREKYRYKPILVHCVNYFGNLWLDIHGCQVSTIYLMRELMIFKLSPHVTVQC